MHSNHVEMAFFPASVLHRSLACTEQQVVQIQLEEAHDSLLQTLVGSSDIWQMGRNFLN